VRRIKGDSRRVPEAGTAADTVGAAAAGARRRRARRVAAKTRPATPARKRLYRTSRDRNRSQKVVNVIADKERARRDIDGETRRVKKGSSRANAVGAAWRGGASESRHGACGDIDGSNHVKVIGDVYGGWISRDGLNISHASARAVAVAVALDAADERLHQAAHTAQRRRRGGARPRDRRRQRIRQRCDA
jgi:hypothetical protein